jgi:hypothetical protein
MVGVVTHVLEFKLIVNALKYTGADSKSREGCRPHCDDFVGDDLLLMNEIFIRFPRGIEASRVAKSGAFLGPAVPFLQDIVPEQSMHLADRAKQALDGLRYLLGILFRKTPLNGGF